jgi:hypothetical protein
MGFGLKYGLKVIAPRAQALIGHLDWQDDRPH